MEQLDGYVTAVRGLWRAIRRLPASPLQTATSESTITEDPAAGHAT
jgi:hypothetical protein